MIVNYTEDGWSIITQSSHGLLAAQICAHYKKSLQPKRWVETLVATADHDDVNNEFERTNLLEENGGPANFKMDPFDESFCDYLIHMGISKGRYVGLLISRHIQFLYNQDLKAKPYCRDLKIKEKKWLKEAGATKTEIDKSYKLLEFCDAFSLLICQKLIQPKGRKIEISEGPEGKSYELVSGHNNQLIVTPWPFETDSFAVNYEERMIKQLTFTNTGEFKSAFFSAPVELIEVIISKK